MYPRILRTSEVWMEMSCWENFITEEQCVIYRQSIYYYVLFPPIFLILPLKQLRKQALKFFLVTNITISHNITISDISSSSAANASQIFTKVPEPATVHLADDTKKFPLHAIKTYWGLRYSSTHSKHRH